MQNPSSPRNGHAARLLGLVLAAVSLGGCVNSATRFVVQDTVCISPVPPRRTPLPVATPEQRAALVTAGFSPQAVHVADVIGSAGALLAAVEAASGRNGRPTVDPFATYQMALSINRAVLEVQGSLATLQCQGGRIDQLQAQLTQREADINRNLSLAAILIGAATNVASGGLGFVNAVAPTNVASIVGGVIGAVPSVFQLDISATGRLRLQQNMLEEFWRAPETPTLFNIRVWRYLTWRDHPGAPTERELIMETWRRDGLIPDEDPTSEPPAIILERERLSSDDLQTLKAILEPIEVRIGLMARDLGRLIEELLERPPPNQLIRQGRTGLHRLPASPRYQPG
jgi:hypothetical protein